MVRMVFQATSKYVDECGSANGLIMNPNVATNGKNLVAVSDFDSAENYKVVYNFDRKRVLENPSTLMYNLLRK